MKTLQADQRSRLLTILHVLEHYEIVLRDLEQHTELADDQGALSSAYGHLSRSVQALKRRFV